MTAPYRPRFTPTPEPPDWSGVGLVIAIVGLALGLIAWLAL